MADNKTLAVAKANKKDEFYTQRVDIENELKYYKPHFAGKVVYCNCDDPYESWFFKYFAMNFNALGLKKLIVTSYDGSSVAGTELALFEGGGESTAYKIVIDRPIDDFNGDGAVDDEDVRIYLQKFPPEVLVSDDDYKPGDFRSRQCIELLKEADIVVTNPPFSLFREYIAQLMEYGKSFLILGRMSAIHYSEVFPHILSGKLWMGCGFNISMVYRTSYENNLEANKKFVKAKGYDPDKNFIKVPAICWFTNLDHKKRHEKLDLYKRYTPEEYPTYYNFDAINVDVVSDIPCDYEGMMGVPDTLLGQFNPDQFELVGLGRDGEGITVDRSIYPTIKKLNPNSRPSHIGFFTKDGKAKEPYSRIIVRLKNPQKAAL